MYILNLLVRPECPVCSASGMNGQIYSVAEATTLARTLPLVPMQVQNERVTNAPYALHRGSLLRNTTLKPTTSQIINFFILLSVLICIYGGFTPTASAETRTIVYQSEFVTDPHWTTDQPDNFYWDEGEEALFARTYNRPDPNYSPSRYYYTETTLNPRLSYELTWDMKILSMGPTATSSGVAVFGLYGDNLYGFNPLNINFWGNDQDGTFSTRLMTLEGYSRYIFTEVNPGFNYYIGKRNEDSFLFETWYTITERYSVIRHEYTFEIRYRGNESPIFTKIIAADPHEPVNPELQNIGISMHPEGTGATNLGYGTRIEGFTEYLIDNVTLTQITDENYFGPTSVLFLPGIQSSRLYKDGLPFTEDQLWEPNRNQDVAQLAMNELGQSIEDIYTRDTIGAVFGYYDIYGSFEKYLEKIKQSGVISDWTAFPYDWRYSVSDVAKNGTQYEDERRSLVHTVETLAEKNSSHITIIAHSNGGLLAKAILNELKTQGKDYLIERIIFVASPQLGTPKAIGSILHGYGQGKLGGWLISAETAREVIRNFPGAYGLLPSEEYFAQVNEPILSFETASTTALFTNAYGNTIDSIDGLEKFMVGTVDGRPVANNVNEVSDANETMLLQAREMHREVLDTLVAPPHIQVIEIVGTGLDTVKGFEYQEFIKKTCINAGAPAAIVCFNEPYYEPVPLFTQYGDETVVATSAQAYPGENKLTYYVDLNEVKTDEAVENVTHADITGLSSLQQFIGGLLQGATTTTQFIYSTSPVFENNREVIAVHSPVSLSLADTLGNTVGKFGTGTSTVVRTDVPGSSFFEIGGATYIVVPQSTEYDVVIKGLGEGSYTLTIDSLMGEASPTQISALENATTSSTTEARFSKRAGTYSDILIDYDGDGSVDETKTLNGEPTTPQLYAQLRNMMTGLVMLKESEQSWLINAVSRAERTGIRKGDDSGGVERIFSQIDARLLGYQAEGRVSLDEYSMIKSLMQEIMSR